MPILQGVVLSTPGAHHRGFTWKKTGYC